MINSSIRVMSCAILAISCIQADASDKIKVTVKTSEKTAAAIGFSVNGDKTGSLGKSHTSKGPMNQEYHFGFRKNSAFGEDISCGALILTQSSTVNLIYQDQKCFSVLG